jgi:hypothetical protein
MGTGPGGQQTLKVDPELLKKYGGQLLTAAGDLPDAPPPFIVPGTDAISQAVAEKLPMIEGGFQEALPQLKSEASSTATKVTEAAGHYANTDAELAANYEKHQFDSASPGGSGSSGAGGGSDAMSQVGQMMSMPMQMASQAAQMPMQAMSAVAQVPQSVMQGVQQIGQMAGSLGGSSEGSSGTQAGKAAEDGAGQPGDRKDEDRDKKDEPGASAGDAKAERAPEPAPVAPQQSSPHHAAQDPGIDL